MLIHRGNIGTENTPNFPPAKFYQKIFNDFQEIEDHKKLHFEKEKLYDSF